VRGPARSRPSTVARGSLVATFLLPVALAGGACTRARAPAPSARQAPSGSEAADGADGAELLGTTPGEWEATHWLHSEPLTLASLRGKVVLVRWWTAGCPYCEATAPSLRELDRAYRARGLVVVGLYHHKGDGPLDEAIVDRTAEKYGFTFPVAVDPEWRTLERWWQVRARGRDFTSVSFVLDRHGTIRHVHPGGAYGPGSADYDAMQAAIEALLADPG
jgi:peroxiredoxin